MAYLAQTMDRTAVSRLMAISWQAVGSIVERVVARQLDPAPCRAEMDAILAGWAHSRFPGHALTPTGVMAIRCKQFHLPDL